MYDLINWRTNCTCLAQATTLASWCPSIVSRDSRGHIGRPGPARTVSLSQGSCSSIPKSQGICIWNFVPFYQTHLLLPFILGQSLRLGNRLVISTSYISVFWLYLGYSKSFPSGVHSERPQGIQNPQVQQHLYPYTLA